MKNAISLNKNLLIFGIPISILGLLVFIMQSNSIVKTDTLNLAISLDLLVSVPFIYFLLIRKTKIPKTTIVPIMIIGLLLGYQFLPKDQHFYLNLFKTWALPVIELSVLAIIILKVRSAIIKYKTLKGGTPDFYNALKTTCNDILPKRMAIPFATEVAVFYYGFLNWKKRELEENEFSYHKRSGSSSLFGALILIIGVETIAIHIVLAKYSHLAAWILSLLSVYTAIQFLGFAKSLSRRPIAINDHSLYLKYGIMNEVEIPFENIKHIELSRKTIPDDKLTRKLSILGDLESHNVRIYLHHVDELKSLYGMRKKFKDLALHVDDAELFVDKIQSKLISETS